MNISGVSSAGYLYASTASRGLGGDASSQSASAGSSSGSQQLSPDEQAQVEKLKARDRQVRQHEQAHMSAGAGLLTSGASFTYQKGPDGVNYAIGGEVGISTSPGHTPAETIQRARQIRAAALAPADPSGQDRAVAAQAAQMEQQAQLEKAQQSSSEQENGGAEQMAAIKRAYSTYPETGASSFSAYA